MLSLFLTILIVSEPEEHQYPFYLKLTNVDRVITVSTELEECKNQKIKWFISPMHGYVVLGKDKIKVDPPDERNHFIVAQGEESFCTGWYNLRARD